MRDNFKALARRWWLPLVLAPVIAACKKDDPPPRTPGSGSIVSAQIDEDARPPTERHVQVILEIATTEPCGEGDERYGFLLDTDRDPATGATEFGIGLGTVVLAANVGLLSSYTLGCHAMRHVVGGAHDEVSKHPACDRAYACSSALNLRHQLFAWCSLFSVGFADIYVRLCSMGIWTDLRIL